MGGRKVLYLLGLFGSFLFLAIANKTLAASNILISQIQTSGGTGATNFDFIELYNQADQSFELKGCKLVKRTAAGSTDTNIKSWSTSTIIPTHSYYLWANANYTTITTTPDITTSETISDNNSIALRCGTGDPLTIMDALTWGEVVHPLGEGDSPNNLEPNQTLQRKSINSSQQDTDNNSVDFEISSPNPHNSSFVENNNTTITQIHEIVNTVYIPAPKVIVNPGEVVINEFVSDPVAGDSEWIELYNKSNKTFNLSDFTLEDASGSNMQLSGTLGTDQFNRFFVVKNLKFTLNNDSESILLKFQGQIIDQISYSKTPTNLSALAPTKPNSLSRIPDGQDTDQNNLDFKISNTTPSLSNQAIDPISLAEEINEPSLIVNEIFPNSLFSDENEEFIELFNNSQSNIDLNNWLIKDNLSTYKINNEDFPNTIIEPNKFFILPRAVTNLVLDNETKETVEISSPDKKTTIKATYPSPAPEAQSYSRDIEGKYFWSLTITPNQTNVINVPNLPPKITLSTPNDGLINQLLIFDASDSADPELSVLKYLWDFGDGYTSNLATPSHAYAQEKTYNVLLTITDNLNAQAKKSVKIKITNNDSATPSLDETKTNSPNSQKITPSLDNKLITGLVTIPPGIISKNTFYLDSFEYPIQISKPLDFIKSGQQISLSGQIKNYTTGPKFFVGVNDSVLNLGLGELPEPQETNLADISLNQDNTLIKVSGQIDRLNTKSLNIKDNEDLLKIYSAAGLDKNTLIKGQQIQAVGFLKYERGEPKLYITDNNNIKLEKILSPTKEDVIEIPTTEHNYNYLYALSLIGVIAILIVLFWNKLLKLKIISQIKKLLSIE